MISKMATLESGPLGNKLALELWGNNDKDDIY